MTLLFETFVPVIVLIGACLISMGLVMLLMSLGLPDEEKSMYYIPEPVASEGENNPVVK